MASSEPPGFLTLPREIRDTIYVALLAPTGYVTLLEMDHGHNKSRYSCMRAIAARMTPRFRNQNPRPLKILARSKYEPNISLRILRTCKQIYAEARSVFFKFNCLDLSTWYIFSTMDMDSQLSIATRFKQWKDELTYRFEEIEVAYGMDDSNDLKFLLELLKDSPGLRRLTLRNGKCDGLMGVLDCQSPWDSDSPCWVEPTFDFPYEDVVEVLEIFAGAFDRKLEKRLTFHNMRLGRPEDWLGLKVTNEPPYMPDVAKALHNAFGGELWVNRKLWMKDRKAMIGIEDELERMKEQERKEQEREENGGARNEACATM